MKHLASGGPDQRLLPGRQIRRHAAFFAAAIYRIPDNGMMNRSAMNPNLMRAAGMNLYPK
jgi:hypothetical protein